MGIMQSWRCCLNGSRCQRSLLPHPCGSSISCAAQVFFSPCASIASRDLQIKSRRSVLLCRASMTIYPDTCFLKIIYICVICVICVYTIRIGIWTTKPNCPYVAFFHAPHPQPLDAGAAVAAPAPRLFSSKLRWRAAACPSTIPCTKTAPLHHRSPEKFDLINSQSYQSPAAKPLRNLVCQTYLGRPFQFCHIH